MLLRDMVQCGTYIYIFSYHLHEEVSYVPECTTPSPSFSWSQSDEGGLLISEDFDDNVALHHKVIAQSSAPRT
jgi:hypothetical protein